MQCSILLSLYLYSNSCKAFAIALLSLKFNSPILSTICSLCCGFFPLPLLDIIPLPPELSTLIPRICERFLCSMLRASSSAYFRRCRKSPAWRRSSSCSIQTASGVCRLCQAACRVHLWGWTWGVSVQALYQYIRNSKRSQYI